MARVTLLEVARLAEVHPSTASRALNSLLSGEVSEATRQRVLEAARQLGYRTNIVAQGLRKGRTGTIGIVISNFEQMYNGPFLRGITVSLEAGGLLPFVSETQDSSERLENALDHLVGRRADAVIIAAARASDEVAIAKVATMLPVVLAIRRLPEARLPTVAHDDFEGGYLAAKHLTELGHTRIAELAGAPDVSSFVDRRAGFAAGLNELGLRAHGFNQAARTPSTDEGRRMTTDLVSQTRHLPTAVFAHNDLLAQGAIDAFAAVGIRCPDEVSIVGYDDIPLTDHLTPPLTSVRLPSLHIGRLAGEMVLSLLEDPEAPAPRVSLPAELIVRGSTAPLDTR